MEDNTYTITGGPLQPHEYVIIRREITAGDEAWIQNHATRIDSSSGKPEVQLTLGDVQLAMLKRMIIGWQLTKMVPGLDGNEVRVETPFSAEAIEKLPRRISAYINKKINELNPDEESDEDFTSAAAASSDGSSKKTKTPQAKA